MKIKFTGFLKEELENSWTVYSEMLLGSEFIVPQTVNDRVTKLTKRPSEKEARRIKSRHALEMLEALSKVTDKMKKRLQK